MNVPPISPVVIFPGTGSAFTPAQANVAPASFSQMIENGVNGVNEKVTAADKAVHAFLLDDSIPVHQVSYALERARLSLEMMLQVRGRLVEGYQQLMNMQI